MLKSWCGWFVADWLGMFFTVVVVSFSFAMSRRRCKIKTFRISGLFGISSGMGVLDLMWAGLEQG